jgi:hypothetical protein
MARPCGRERRGAVVLQAVADVTAATVYRFVMVHRSEEQSVRNVRLSLTEARR